MAVALLLACALFVAACGDEKEKAASKPAATDSPNPRRRPAAKVPAPKPGKAVKLPKPTLQLKAGKTYVATVPTNCGEFEITLDPKRAPAHGRLVRPRRAKGFYDGLRFHRIVPGFVIQGGDPQRRRQRRPGLLRDEAPPDDLVYSKGVVAMAKTETEAAGTSGSQFFVVTGETRGSRPTTRCSARSRRGRTSST